MKNYKIKFTPLEKQSHLFDDDITDTIMLASGLGFGKSYCLAMKLIKLSRLNKSCAGGLLSPSYADFKRDLYPIFEDILESSRIPYRFHKMDKTYIFPWSKFPIYVFSGDAGNIAGPNLGYCGINEFSIIEPTRINEMMRRVRVRDTPCMQKILVGTPEDKYGFLEDFIENQNKRNLLKENSFKLIQADTRENIHIDPEYRSFLEATLDDQSLKVFASGQIVKIGGNYFYYSMNKNINVAPIQYNSDLITHIGLDFNVGYMTASLSHRIDNKLLVYGEICLTGDSNTYTMANVLEERFDKSKCIITCDASGAARKSSASPNALTDIKILRQEGFEVRYKGQNSRLRKRQIVMNSLLYHNRIIIDPSCKLIIKDLEKTQQKQDFTKDPGKENKLGHFSDGLDYVCDFEFGNEFAQREDSRSILL